MSTNALAYKSKETIQSEMNLDGLKTELKNRIGERCSIAYWNEIEKCLDALCVESYSTGWERGYEKSIEGSKTEEDCAEEKYFAIKKAGQASSDEGGPWHIRILPKKIAKWGPDF